MSEIDSFQQKIWKIGHEIRTQDNLATSLPIFCVQQKRRITGIDPEYADDSNILWYYDELLCKEDSDKLEKIYQESGFIDSGYTRIAYIDIWEFVTACFTRVGAENYIKSNGHNLKEPRIYVESGYRNEEWDTIRTFLKLLEAIKDEL